MDRELLQLAYGADFVQAVPVFRVLLLEAALTCLGQVLLQAFLASGRPAVPSMVQIASLAVIVAGLLALAPAFGALEAAVALTLGALVRLGLLLGNLRRIGLGLPSPVPNRDDLVLLLDAWRRRRVAGGSEHVD